MALEVNTDGSIGAAFLPRPFVETNHDWCWSLRYCLSVHGPQQRSRTGGHGKHVRKASATLAPSSEGDAPECIAETSGPSRIGRECGAKALSKGFLGTACRITKEAPDAQQEDETSSNAGNIGDGSDIVAMNAGVNGLTLRTDSSKLC